MGFSRAKHYIDFMYANIIDKCHPSLWKLKSNLGNCVFMDLPGRLQHLKVIFFVVYIHIYIYIYASLFTNLNKYIFSENISFYIVVVSLPLVICVLYMGKFTFVFVFSCNKKEITKRQS